MSTYRIPTLGSEKHFWESYILAVHREEAERANLEINENVFRAAETRGWKFSTYLPAMPGRKVPEIFKLIIEVLLRVYLRPQQKITIKIKTEKEVSPEQKKREKEEAENRTAQCVGIGVLGVALGALGYYHDDFRRCRQVVSNTHKTYNRSCDLPTSMIKQNIQDLCHHRLQMDLRRSGKVYTLIYMGAGGAVGASFLLASTLSAALSKSSMRVAGYMTLIATGSIGIFRLFRHLRDAENIQPHRLAILGNLQDQNGLASYIREQLANYDDNMKMLPAAPLPSEAIDPVVINGYDPNWASPPPYNPEVVFQKAPPPSFLSL